eukprot:TRINITY_DN17022_c0_g1_i1.p1 TRINITY_DN17022_c0_g1~~TRINITY_DN17022_c0_g1_i1.p1  ORF type:complete len:347 (-),score=49.50 TRINITY_DN17022_c0_g1_i1:46-1086(-)
MHHGDLKSDSVDDLIGILQLADKYCVNRAIWAASERLRTSIKELSDCCRCLEFFSENYSVQLQQQIENICTSFLLKTFSNFEIDWKKPEFKSLPISALLALLNSSELSVMTENTVFAAAEAWVAADPDRSSQWGTLFPYIRFHFMTSDYLYFLRFRKFPLKEELKLVLGDALAFKYAQTKEEKQYIAEQYELSPTNRGSEVKNVKMEWTFDLQKDSSGNLLKDKWYHPTSDSIRPFFGYNITLRAFLQEKDCTFDLEFSLPAEGPSKRAAIRSPWKYPLNLVVSAALSISSINHVSKKKQCTYFQKKFCDLDSVATSKLSPGELKVTTTLLLVISKNDRFDFKNND